jgi:3-deoxy-D-manno-octulosonic acid kinase
VTLAPRQLPEYTRIDRGGWTARVHPDFATHVSIALFEGSGRRASGRMGRAEIDAIDTPMGTVLVRRCLRGGMLGPILSDRYFFMNRPLHELTMHREAYRRGVNTVLPVAAMWKRSGAVVRGSIATLKVDADDLLALCAGGNRPADADLAACGRAIQSMHEAGLIHADLQMKNVLARDGQGWVIDFDKAKFVSEVGLVHARQNFLRLKRSFQKHAIPIGYFDAVREAYEAAGDVKIPL